MDSVAFVQLALDTLSCSQKELAVQLKVSPTQVSKWKQGDHMSFDMENKFRALVGIGDKNPEFVVLAGSIESADKWEDLIRFLADAADEWAETGYRTHPLTDELHSLSWQTFDTLRNMGVTLPRSFPPELDINYEEDDVWEVIDANPYSSLIYKIYKSFTNVYGFYMAYVYELLSDEALDLGEETENIEPCLLDLAASKLDLQDVQGLATKFQHFGFRVRQDYGKWLNAVKEAAFRAGVPLRAELLHLAYRSDEELGHEAEGEHLGFNSTRLHPDVYMDELLRGMRLIHQVLPAIMKKLDITEDEFQLDDSELRIH